MNQEDAVKLLDAIIGLADAYYGMGATLCDEFTTSSDIKTGSDTLQTTISDFEKTFNNLTGSNISFARKFSGDALDSYCPDMRDWHIFM